jgi:predicted enzyme related to lactoylglutathione lyase
MMINFSGLMIGSAQPERLVEFYNNLFGKPAWAMDNFVGWQIGKSWLMVGPHSEVKGPNASPGRLIWFLETDDVPGEFERFKQLGAQVVAAPYRPDPSIPTMWLATLADPDNNYFQLTTPQPPTETA